MILLPPGSVFSTIFQTFLFQSFSISGFKSGVVCVTLLNRLNEDQVNLSYNVNDIDFVDVVGVVGVVGIFDDVYVIDVDDFVDGDYVVNVDGDVDVVNEADVLTISIDYSCLQ